MSTIATYLLLFGCLTYVGVFGFWLGIQRERDKAWALTSFAATLFRRLRQVDEGDKLHIELIRMAGDTYQASIGIPAKRDPDQPLVSKIPKPWKRAQVWEASEKARQAGDQ